MQLLDYKDYRPFLKDELERRVSANPKYSLRAFARDLDIAPQTLSSVLKGKKGVSLEVAAEISDRLELNPHEASYFLDLVSLAHARSPKARKIAEFRVQERLSAQPSYKSLEVDAFKVISDWYHYAILELVQSQGFRSDFRWIASRLGISTHEVEGAITRLKNLEMMEEDSKGNLRRTEFHLSASYAAPSAAIRKFSRQVLSKAIVALEEQSIYERDITTMTMAIDPTLLPMAQEMIAQFRRKLCRFLEQGSRTEVYTFVPALFRISKPIQNHKPKRSS